MRRPLHLVWATTVATVTAVGVGAAAVPTHHDAGPPAGSPRARTDLSSPADTAALRLTAEDLATRRQEEQLRQAVAQALARLAARRAAEQAGVAPRGAVQPVDLSAATPAPAPSRSVAPRQDAPPPASPPRTHGATGASGSSGRTGEPGDDGAGHDGGGPDDGGGQSGGGQSGGGDD